MTIWNTTASTGSNWFQLVHFGLESDAVVFSWSHGIERGSRRPVGHPQCHRPPADAWDPPPRRPPLNAAVSTRKALAPGRWPEPTSWLGPMWSHLGTNKESEVGKGRMKHRKHRRYVKINMNTPCCGFAHFHIRFFSRIAIVRQQLAAGLRPKLLVKFMMGSSTSGSRLRLTLPVTLFRLPVTLFLFFPVLPRNSHGCFGALSCSCLTR